MAGNEKDRSPGSVIDAVRLQCLNAAKECQDKGCRLNLRGLDAVVVDRPDTVIRDRGMCDCIVFCMLGPDCFAVVTELKGKTTKVTTIVTQLQNGVDLASEMISRTRNRAVAWKVYVLCLAQRWKSSELKTVRRKRVQVAGRKCLIVTKRCGTDFLAEIARKMPHQATVRCGPSGG